MKKSIQKGFTLIELMIVVAILGIVAAVAIPQYYKYVTKAKISQSITAVKGSYQMKIADCYTDQLRMDRCQNDQTKYNNIKSIQNSGVITGVNELNVVVNGNIRSIRIKVDTDAKWGTRKGETYKYDLVGTVRNSVINWDLESSNYGASGACEIIKCT